MEKAGHNILRNEEGNGGAHERSTRWGGVLGGYKLGSPGIYSGRQKSASERDGRLKEHRMSGGMEYTHDRGKSS